MAYVNLTRTDGTTTPVDPTTVRAIVPLADDPNALVSTPRCRVIANVGAVVLDVLGTVAATETALATGGVALLVSQLVSGPTTTSGLSAIIVPGGSPQLQTIQSPGVPAPLTRVSWDDGKSVVLAVALATVATALAGSAPSGGSGLVLAAGVCNNLGVVLGQVSNLDITVANAAGHVADSGSYVHAVSGADAPAAFLVATSPMAIEAQPYQGFSTGPGSFTILTGSSIKGSGASAADGTMTDAIRVFRAAPYVPGSGQYLYQCTAPGNFVVTPSIRDVIPVGGARISYSVTGPDTFTVHIVDDLLAGIDLPHTVVVTPVAPNQSVTPADGGYAWEIIGV